MLQGSVLAVNVIAPTILPTTDIQGPGGYRPGDYIGFFNGTSCAAPYAAGVCALIKSANPTWGPATIKAQLTATAIDIVNVESGVGWDRYTGYGLVDAAAAVSAMVVLPPEANFTGSPLFGCYPLTVEFSDLSSGDVTSWSWTFGDGETSNEQNPQHTYTSPGIYDVTLQTTGPVGTDSRFRSAYATVEAPAIANFTSTVSTGQAPWAVTFIDMSTNASGRIWDFGDAHTDTARYPVHTYTEQGIYTVTLITTGGCIPDTMISADYVTVHSASAVDDSVPVRFALGQNNPNPFNPQTTISFDLPEQGAVILRVFDVSGRMVRVLVGGEMHDQGRHDVVWNGRDDTGRRVASGTYF
jgi:PKD repeat protein